MDLLNATGMQAGYTLGVEPSGREHLVVAVKGTFAFPEVPEARRLQLTWRSSLPLMRSTVSESSPFGYHQGQVRESSGEYRLN